MCARHLGKHFTGKIPFSLYRKSMVGDYDCLYFTDEQRSERLNTCVMMKHE